MDKGKKEFEVLLQDFRTASSYEQQNEVMEKINAIGNDYSTQANLVYIRASIDTNDEYYQKERDFFDEIGPEYQELETEFYRKLISTPFRRELESRWGSQLFALADNAIRSFS